LATDVVLVLGWSWWLLLLLPQAAEYKMPIYITETGIADRSDVNRATMIDKYMRAVSC